MNKDYRTSIFKKKIEKIFSLSLILILITVILSGIRNISSLSKSKIRVKEAEERLRKLKEENEMLIYEEGVVDSLEFKEAQIRNKLNLVKEGEIMVILPEEKVVKKFAIQGEVAESKTSQPYWRQWLSLFF